MPAPRAHGVYSKTGALSRACEVDCRGRRWAQMSDFNPPGCIFYLVNGLKHRKVPLFLIGSSCRGLAVFRLPAGKTPVRPWQISGRRTSTSGILPPLPWMKLSRNATGCSMGFLPHDAVEEILSHPCFPDQFYFRARAKGPGASDHPLVPGSCLGRCGFC